MHRISTFVIISLATLACMAGAAQAASIGVMAPQYESPGGTVPVIVTVYNAPRGYAATIRARGTSGATAVCAGPTWRNASRDTVSRKCYLTLPGHAGSHHVRATAHLKKAGHADIVVTGRSTRPVLANGYATSGPISMAEIDKIERCHNATDQVWLTFDDGGSPTQVRSILRTLRANHVRGRFFFTGRWREQTPGLLQEIRAGGHLIANHTYSHVPLSQSSASDVRWQIRHGLTAAANPRLIRPPYAAGALTLRLSRLAGPLGYKVCRWTVDTYDWQGPSAATMANRVRYGDYTTPPIQAGGNILMHGHGENTASGLAGIIRAVRARGLTLEPLPS